MPDAFTTLVDAQKVVMAFEAAQDFEHEQYYHSEKLSGSLVQLIEMGKQCTYDDYVDAQRLADTCRGLLANIQSNYDALLTPSAPGEAPEGLDATGDPLFNRIWTLLHVPSINIPGYRGPNGLPVGVQLVGAMYEDKKLFQVAKWCHTRMG
jgi:Asp-tRNA(Asn)/Glu-tRNA(Gln) amidotransferase A subunit family amidase